MKQASVHRKCCHLSRKDLKLAVLKCFLFVIWKVKFSFFQHLTLGIGFLKRNSSQIKIRLKAKGLCQHQNNGFNISVKLIAYFTSPLEKIFLSSSSSTIAQCVKPSNSKSHHHASMQFTNTLTLQQRARQLYDYDKKCLKFTKQGNDKGL